MAENSVITVSIVTPDGKVYEHTADMVVVTTLSGQLGILPNHIPVIATIAVDEVRVKHDDKEDKIAVNGGFIEFSGDTATIVADSAETQTSIDVLRAQQAKKRAEQRIEQAKAAEDADSLARAQIALRRAINRINVAGK
ncbi:F0F1 ATP synthase subunit epsilon [Lentilactobacillus laojiaonis]|uniref:F0F1 ATP synthase subunit epsilon n=1 Tax=Lentilactobacillus laojiaonis TaxID=2883998 RepID=UPI001D0ACE52|nr:F0F1 ATP synthase subunit epsilon [Lentilactobacillus laojiaonis]UDM31754.1 F0F1 ATP synthase subunit epsilon [Lentilactobacillus laojiaonis]